MKRYGSHFPAGLQALGDIFFSIADVESKSTTDVSELTEAATKHLKSQISVGCMSGAFGIGANVTGEYAGFERKSVNSQRLSSTESFTYSVKSMGPPANPATFHKLLAYSSNWALIDRGSFQGYIPVWELIGDLGNKYREVQMGRESKKAEELIKAKAELQRMKEEHLRSGVRVLNH